VREKFVVHYNDDGLLAILCRPGPAAGQAGRQSYDGGVRRRHPDAGSDGKITIFRKGQLVPDEPLPEVAPRNHWKDWADNCLGDKKPLWTPFDIGSRITEPPCWP